jgi:signal transduction histidine kinase
VEIRPLARFGGDMVSCSISDISDVKRREALEHIFFHDIMNRAAAVQGASNLLADEEILPETRSMVTGMLSACSHALVDEIQSQRTLLAAEKGELAVQMTACDSLEALRAAVVACESLGCAERKQVTVLPDSLPVVFRTDVTLLGRILINLLKNALESADTGTTVTVSCSLYGLDRVRFSIHNDIFMPDRIRAHVFQRSFSTKGAGRGLGTYSVKLLTERYLGGHTWFDSTSKGTTFHVEFDAKTSGFPPVA